MFFVPSSLLIRLFLIILGVLLLAVDYPLILLLHKNTNDQWKFWWRIITDVGEAWPWFLVLTLVVLWGKISGGNVWKQYSRPALFCIWNLLFVGTFLNLIKWIVGRPRPKYFLMDNLIEPNSFAFVNPFKLSFPSGHSQAIWSVAVCLSLYWPEHRKKFFFCAIIVSLSRFMLTHHYLSDVLLGACIGYIGSFWFHSYFASRFFHKKPCCQTIAD